MSSKDFSNKTDVVIVFATVEMAIRYISSTVFTPYEMETCLFLTLNMLKIV